MLTEEECAERLKERRKVQREKVLEKEDNRNRKPWGKEEDEYLIKHLHKKTHAEIGYILGRTMQSVGGRVSVLRKKGIINTTKYRYNRGNW